MDVLGLVFGSGSGIEGVDLHEHLLVRLLRSEGVTRHTETINDKQLTCFLCWSSNLEPSYRSRRERFSILAYGTA